MLPPSDEQNLTTPQTETQSLERDNARETLSSRNWELELLISGAVFFSLFQLPGLIQQYLENAIVQSSSALVIVTLLYVKTLSYVLIFNLGGHFLLRGYWVGLLGLASVFPQEIVWENLPYPPLFIEFYRTRIRPLTATASSVDNICRMIFGFTFLLLLLLLGAVVLYGVVGLLFFVVSIILPQANTLLVAVILFCIVFAPLLFVGTMQSILRRRPQTDSPRLRRILFPVMNALLTFTPSGLSNSIMFTLRSNVAKEKIVSVLTIFLAFIMLAPLVEMLSGYSRHIFFAQKDSPQSMEAAFYENFRQAEGNIIDRTLFRYPSIQADVITDPYIRLFLPYRANDNDSIQARIGNDFRGFHREGLFMTEFVREDDSTRTRALAGLSSIYTVSVNDSLYTSLEFFFHKHPQTGAPGLLTYIPTQGLKHGKNLLVVRKFGKKSEYFIPFYVAPR
jgi:hypothetical protein